MTETTIAQGKQARKTFALFYEGATPELIGRGIEELSIEQGANVESKRDITGFTEVVLDSYEKTTALDPIYIAGGSQFSELLDNIEENELTGDAVVHPFLWVKLYKKTADGKYAAFRQEAVVELTGFGGDVKGVNAPCTLHWCGERTMGSFDPVTKTFTTNA